MKIEAFIIWAMAMIGAIASTASGNYFSKFELVKGIIVVEAQMNGTYGNFILDTGAPTIVLNSSRQMDMKPADRIQEKERLGLPTRRIEQFQWAGIEREGLNAVETDMSSLETLTKMPISGLIGYNFLEGLELLLDFENEIASLVMDATVSHPNNWELMAKIPFDMAGHLPVLTAKIGGNTLRFGLDTGANTNLLDARKLLEVDPAQVTLMDGSPIMGLLVFNEKAVDADIEETNLQGLAFRNMRYVFTDISHLKNLSEHHVDGLFGFPFFRIGKFSINYASQELSIWR